MYVVHHNPTGDLIAAIFIFFLLIIIYYVAAFINSRK